MPEIESRDCDTHACGGDKDCDRAINGMKGKVVGRMPRKIIVLPVSGSMPPDPRHQLSSCEMGDSADAARPLVCSVRAGMLYYVETNPFNVQTLLRNVQV